MTPTRAMLEGLPTLVEHVIGKMKSEPPRGSLSLVIHHLLGDVVNAAEYAVTHYLPLTLREPYLQDSSVGSPYQKWAYFTNEDFQTLDACVRRLLPVAYLMHEHPLDSERWGEESQKDAWYWFDTVKTTYAACVIDQDQPSLTLSSVNLAGWREPGKNLFRYVMNRAEPLESVPAIVTTTRCDISDRRAVAELHRTGLARVEELRALSSGLGAWLRATCTLESLTAPHRGTLSDACMES